MDVGVRVGAPRQSKEAAHYVSSNRSHTEGDEARRSRMLQVQLKARVTQSIEERKEGKVSLLIETYLIDNVLVYHYPSWLID